MDANALLREARDFIARSVRVGTACGPASRVARMLAKLDAHLSQAPAGGEAGIYESAVRGRQEFRAALVGARSRIGVALAFLETVRTEKLAAAGLHPEAEAVSRARVALDAIGPASVELVTPPAAGGAPAPSAGCPEKRKPGGCQLHNLHCRYPECDRGVSEQPVRLTYDHMLTELRGAPAPTPRADTGELLTDSELSRLCAALGVKATDGFRFEDCLNEIDVLRQHEAAAPPDQKDLGESKKNQKTRPASLVAADGAWVGDLNDDCWLERYGMVAHVEKMDTNHWWFNVTRDWPDDRPGYEDLFNIADQQTHIPLTTGKMARRAAECCMEILANRKHDAEREARAAAVVGGERDGRNESAPPAAAVGRPVAWMRAVKSFDGETTEYDEECCPGEDRPSGDGWMPLYAAPSVDEHLPDLGSHGPAASSGDGTSAAATPGAVQVKPE